MKMCRPWAKSLSSAYNLLISVRTPERGSLCLYMYQDKLHYFVIHARDHYFPLLDLLARAGAHPSVVAAAVPPPSTPQRPARLRWVRPRSTRSRCHRHRHRNNRHGDCALTSSQPGQQQQASPPPLAPTATAAAAPRTPPSSARFLQWLLTLASPATGSRKKSRLIRREKKEEKRIYSPRRIHILHCSYIFDSFYPVFLSSPPSSKYESAKWESVETRAKNNLGGAEDDSLLY